MGAPSVHLFLHCPPKSAISAPSFRHSPITRKCDLRRHEACPWSRCSGLGRVRSSPWLMDSAPGSFQTAATDEAESCSVSAIELGQANVGRCALASAAAILLFQCAFGEELAIAAAYSPAVAGQQSTSLSGGSLGHFRAPAMTSASASLMKKVTRVGSNHAKGTDGALKQSNGGLRKPVSLVKRPSGGLPQLKNNLLARQIASSPVAVLPVASISAATFGSSFSALTRFGLALDLSVLRSSFGTSVNLLSLCTLVVWMQRSGQLPADTPVILSQVAFRLFIPCFLLSKVATTLSSSSASNLVALPLMALAQVIVGAMLGKVAGQVFFKVPSLQPAVNWSGNQAVDNISSVTFSDDQRILARAATKKQALITAACAFGNSLTLPLVFVSGVLATTEEANLAAGYLALYMVGWSPAMWSVGYKILTAGDEEEGSQSKAVQPIWKSVFKWIGSVMNPPLYGVFVGLLIGGTPLSHLFLGGKEGAVLATTPFDTVGVLAKLRSITAGILSPVFEAVSLLGTATLAVQTVVLATSLGASMSKTGGSANKISHHEADSDTPPLAGDVGTTSLSTKTSETVVLDSKAFWVISGIRLILLPISGMLFTFMLQCFHMLPPDPIYRLVILAESAMPTAQNLVLLAQLNAGTRPLAGMLASLLLRQYAISVFPLTIWMAIFLSFTS